MFISIECEEKNKFCFYNQPSAEGVGVNTITATSCDVENQTKLAWPESGSWKKRRDILKIHFYNSKQLSSDCGSASRVLKPSAYSLRSSPESNFRLFLIKITVVVVGVQRLWMPDRESRSILDHISSPRLFVALPALQHQTQHLSTGFGSVIATARASTPQQLQRLTDN